MKRRHLLVGLVLALLATTPVPARQGEPLRSTDLAGLRLRNIGPANMSGRFVDMDVVESDPQVMYVASATGGVFRTRDSGITWEPVFEREPVHSVGDIALFQPNPNIIWVGTGERANRQSVSWGDGVYKSTDAGQDLDECGAAGQQAHRPHRPAPDQSGHRVRRRAGFGVGPGRRSRALQDARWRQDLDAHAARGRRHRRHGCRDRSVGSEHPLCRDAISVGGRAFGFDGGGPGSGLWKSVDGGSEVDQARRQRPAQRAIWDASAFPFIARIRASSTPASSRASATTRPRRISSAAAGSIAATTRAATWRLMSNWNPRPMYASQPTVDPSDDRRVYMLNAYSFSDNAGETFTTPRQTIARRRPLRVGQPQRLASRDQAGRWRRRHQPRSRPQVPLRAIAAGQPVLPRRGGQRAAIQRLRRLAGQRLLDGTERELDHQRHSQRTLDAVVRRRRFLRRARSEGSRDRLLVRRSSSVCSATTRAPFRYRRSAPAIRRATFRDRRNWNTWGKPSAAEVLGNAMHPANWDAAIMLSPHDSATIYAGGKHLFRSRDRGMTLGRPRRHDDGRRPLHADDHGPQDNEKPHSRPMMACPITRASPPSPSRRAGVACSMSAPTTDGCACRWMTARRGPTRSTRFPGLPASSWVAAIEASRHADGSVYVVFDNHRSNDFGNYIYKSADFGKTWTAIMGDMPADRVARAIREDPRNAGLLYVGDRVRAVDFAESRAELDRAEEQHADAAVQRSGDPRSATTTWCSPRTAAASGFSTT